MGAEVHVGSAGKPAIDAKIIPPNSTAAVPVRLPAAGAGAPEFRYDIIDDYGGRWSYRVALHNSQPSTPASAGNRLSWPNASLIPPARLD